MVALLQNPSAIRLPAPAAHERRMFTRRETQAFVDARRLDHTVSAQRQPRVPLNIRDVSFGGCSASTHMSLERGERVSLYFHGTLSAGAWGAVGRVVRCEPSSLGYRVAFQFDPLPAA